MNPSDGKCYGWPVFRYGIICVPIENMELTQARSIRQELKDNWGIVKTQMAEKPQLFGFSSVKFQRENPKEEVLEGPAVLYPNVSASFRGINYQARTSVTVCAGPRRSKIWFRLSFRGGNGASASSSKLNRAEVERFFNYAEATAEKAVAVYIDAYSRILQRKTGKELLCVHIIKIKTAPANLGSTATLLESGAFRMSDYFDKPKQPTSLRGLLNLTYGRDISSRGEYQSLAKDYRWIAVSIRDGDDIVGLYSVHHSEDETDFTGLVHGISGDPHELSSMAQRFSRELVNDIAPRI